MPSSDAVVDTEKITYVVGIVAASTIYSIALGVYFSYTAAIFK